MELTTQTKATVYNFDQNTTTSQTVRQQLELMAFITKANWPPAERLRVINTMLEQILELS